MDRLSAAAAVQGLGALLLRRSRSPHPMPPAALAPRARQKLTQEAGCSSEQPGLAVQAASYAELIGAGHVCDVCLESLAAALVGRENPDLVLRATRREEMRKNGAWSFLLLTCW